MPEPLNLVPKVEWYNDLLLPLGLYPTINVPEGVVNVCPAVVDNARFLQVLNADPPPVTSGRSHSFGVRGLCKSYLFVRFPDFANQWQTVTGGNHQFQGGDVEICIGIKIYIKDYHWPGREGADGCTDAEFALIMEHEYKHAADEVATVRDHLIPIIRGKAAVQNWLRDRKTIAPQHFRRWFAGYATPRPLDETVWFNRYPPGVQFEISLLQDWATEHNRRANHMDDPDGGEMTRLQERFDELSLNHQMDRHWSGRAGSDPWQG